MCRAGRRSTIAIGGVPFSVDECPRHAHGIGEFALPSGGTARVARTELTRDLLVRALGDALHKVLFLAHFASMAPAAAPLVFGLSIVAPGERVLEAPVHVRAD